MNELFSRHELDRLPGSCRRARKTRLAKNIMIKSTGTYLDPIRVASIKYLIFCMIHISFSAHKLIATISISSKINLIHFRNHASFKYLRKCNFTLID